MCKECKNEDTGEECSETESEVDLLTKDANNTKTVTYEDKSVIDKLTVSVQPMIEEFTTIAESIKEKQVKQITKDYVFTKGQGVNKNMEKMDPD